MPTASPAIPLPPSRRATVWAVVIVGLTALLAVFLHRTTDSVERDLRESERPSFRVLVS
jgi:hypothetical protein